MSERESERMYGKRSAAHKRDLQVVDQNEDHMDEEMVQKMFLDRVMNKMEGRQGAGSSGRITQEQKQIEEDCRNLEFLGAELTGIGKSIEAMINYYNKRIDQELDKSRPLISQDPNLYRDIFSVDTDRIHELIQEEISQKRERSK